MFSLQTPLPRVENPFSVRTFITPSESEAPRVKFKRLDKTARHIMQANSRLLVSGLRNVSMYSVLFDSSNLDGQILDKEAVEEVKAQRQMPEIKPGYIVQLKVVCAFQISITKE